jgi:tetratricopeptide (TPR) repeat protein
VLARDSTLTPAAIHPIEVAMQMRDKAGYDRYLRVLESSGNAQENRAYRGAGDMVFGAGDIDTTTAAAMVRYGGTLAAVLGGLYSGEATSDSVEARFDRWRQVLPGGGQVQYLGYKGITLAGLGRFAAGQTVFDTLVKVNPNLAYGILLLPQMLGFAPSDYQPPALAKLTNAPRKDPLQVYLAAVLALGRGDRAEGARLTDSLLANQTANMPPQFWRVMHAMKGWSVMLAGDTASGIKQMREALEVAAPGWIPFFTAPIRLQLAAALTQRPATREEGRRMLQYGFVYDVGVTPIAQYALGRAEENNGNRAAAAEAYSQFLRLWDRADSSAQPRVTEVREALKRVTGEVKK